MIRKDILSRSSKVLVWNGLVYLLLSFLLLLFIPYNEVEVLGLNSLLKPLKFSLSIWIYSWTMFLILSYVEDKILVKRFELAVIITMLYEQGVITIQAFRGELSHFNNNTLFGSFLFGLMGVLITLLTLYTIYLTQKLKKQNDELHRAFKEAIVLGLSIFIFSSFLGGVMGAINSHQVGGSMGGEGFTFLNWSLKYGDLRVAHFIGIHALQVVPLFAYCVGKFNVAIATNIKLVRLFSVLYFLVVIGTFIHALLGYSLMSLFS